MNKELLAASENGDLNRVRQLLSFEGIEINYKNI